MRITDRAIFDGANSNTQAARERHEKAAQQAATGVRVQHPWDDDVAYTPLVKRLLDIGNLVEPFSFRRLGAYGGQTVLEALAGARGTLANVHLIDKGLCLGLALLAITGYARERRTRPLWLALIVLLVLLLPDTAINTASYWSGAALFLALYRCVVREHWALAGLVGAAACTLRQNFMVVAVVFHASEETIRRIITPSARPHPELALTQRRWKKGQESRAAVSSP